jgi:adenylylsulfate kinase
MARSKRAAGVKSRNLSWQDGSVSPADRERLLGQRGCVVWLTGLSGSGKSTVARALESRLTELGHPCYVLDGDNVRHGLNRDLGFSPADRSENIRRVGEVAALMADAGLVTIAAFISPYRAGRRAARTACGGRLFFEVFLDASIEVCRRRDPKGLYAKARRGRVKQFTGVSAPYERPLRPEITLDSERLSVHDCAEEVLRRLEAEGILRRPRVAWASPAGARGACPCVAPRGEHTTGPTPVAPMAETAKPRGRKRP